MGGYSRIAGIDGCKAGWFVVAADASLNTIDYFVAADIHGAAAALHDGTVVGIDIPIGVPDAGPRQCDSAARRLLSPGRTSSVFPAPIRPILGVRDYRQACDLRESVDGKRMSAQAFNILHKIDEVDRFVRAKSSIDLLEVHPELAFVAINNGAPMRHAKRTAEGFNERYARLAGHFETSVLDAALGAFPRSKVARDDVLDAFAVLLAAARISTGQGRRVPAESVLDSAGIEMSIWY